MVATPDLLSQPPAPAPTFAPPNKPDRALAAVPVTDDVIEYTLACALALSPPEIRAYLRDHVLPAVAPQSRRVFGSSMRAIRERNARIKREYQAGERYAFLAMRHQLTERRIRQIIESQN